MMPTPEEIHGITVPMLALLDKLEEAEDARAMLALEAFTAPDADWGIMLDSLRARIQSIYDARKEAEQERDELRVRLAEVTDANHTLGKRLATGRP